jgi:hypothetical protein
MSLQNLYLIQNRLAAVSGVDVHIYVQFPRDPLPNKNAKYSSDLLETKGIGRLAIHVT